MTERGEGLARAPKVYSLGEQGQLRRRRLYALHEMPGLSPAARVALEGWSAEVAHPYRRLAALLAVAGVPVALPRNAASPARLRPRP